MWPFSRRAEDIAPEELEHFGWEGGQNGGVKESPEGDGEMSASLVEQGLMWTSTFYWVCFQAMIKNTVPELWHKKRDWKGCNYEHIMTRQNDSIILRTIWIVLWDENAYNSLSFTDPVQQVHIHLHHISQRDRARTHIELWSTQPFTHSNFIFMRYILRCVVAFRVLYWVQIKLHGGALIIHKGWMHFSILKSAVRSQIDGWTWHSPRS